jgi:hypothetical protein
MMWKTIVYVTVIIVLVTVIMDVLVTVTMDVLVTVTTLVMYILVLVMDTVQQTHNVLQTVFVIAIM